MSLSKSGTRDDNLMSNAEEMSVYHHLNGRITLCVQSLVNGAFGVYANAVLIAIHRDRGTADAHCERLRTQQAED